MAKQKLLSEMNQMIVDFFHRHSDDLEDYALLNPGVTVTRDGYGKVTMNITFIPDNEFLDEMFRDSRPENDVIVTTSTNLGHQAFRQRVRPGNGIQYNAPMPFHSFRVDPA
jgi:hypothetical protein